MKHKFNDTFQCIIDSLDHEGRGIAHIDGKIVFVHNALPGESVTAKYTSFHGKYNEADAVLIENQSEMRVSPQCSHYDLCGGCGLQHMSHVEQLKHKENILKEHLQHFGNIQPKEWLVPLQDECFGYRKKARVSVRFIEKKNKSVVGFYERNNSFITDIKNCEILDQTVGSKIDVISHLITQLDANDKIPQIEVAVGDDRQALVFRHLIPLSVHDKNLILEFGKKNNFDLYLQPKGPNTIHKIWPEDGNNLLSYFLKSFGVTLFFHPNDFVQINFGMNRKMVDLAIDLLELESQDNVLDLFCGLGNFTLPIATRCKSVIGVEGAMDMVNRASQNAQYNKLSNVLFECDNLDQKSFSKKWATQSYDKLLLDPPRAGALNVLANIKTFSPKRIVYVSCNTATLARDVGFLVHDHGYTLQKAGIMDMFPHTKHVESIVLLTK